MYKELRGILLIRYLDPNVSKKCISFEFVSMQIEVSIYVYQNGQWSGY
jgi:hypothetical protein